MVLIFQLHDRLRATVSKIRCESKAISACPRKTSGNGDCGSMDSGRRDVLVRMDILRISTLDQSNAGRRSNRSWYPRHQHIIVSRRVSMGTLLISGLIMSSTRTPGPLRRLWQVLLWFDLYSGSDFRSSRGRCTSDLAHSGLHRSSGLSRYF